MDAERLDDTGLARLRERVAQGSLRLAGADIDAGLWLVPDMTAVLARLDAAEAERDALRDSLRRTQEALQGMAARVAAQSELLSKRAEKESPGE
jgi:hypothetical protein